jgi:hypothetical protein
MELNKATAKNMNNEEIAKEIEKLELKLTETQSQIKNLKLKISKTEKPKWEPEGGYFWISSGGKIGSSGSTDLCRLFGAEFETVEAAEKACEVYRFYHNLYKLAEELNPSGKVGGRYKIFIKDGLWTPYESFMDTIDALFETKLSAQAACNIMNQNGWELPLSAP